MQWSAMPRACQAAEICTHLRAADKGSGFEVLCQFGACLMNHPVLPEFCFYLFGYLFPFQASCLPSRPSPHGDEEQAKAILSKEPILPPPPSPPSRWQLNPYLTPPQAQGSLIRATAENTKAHTSGEQSIPVRTGKPGISVDTTSGRRLRRIKNNIATAPSYKSLLSPFV